MGNHLSSSRNQQPQPPPYPVTITGIRFPADGSQPHLLSITTTTHGVSDGPDSFWGHVPDLQEFWKTKTAWQLRDVEIFRLENQPVASCNGLYVLFYYSFDIDTLPENRNFLEAVFGRERCFAGDAFVVRLKGNEIGADVGDDGWVV